mmetsp:Transcript_10826/g.28921  ORF Transcript_10826/g.28921 Transcript_10826/m.28921 type:complete len:207 (+) Transcript_10826:232-852(+)
MPRSVCDRFRCPAKSGVTTSLTSPGLLHIGPSGVGASCGCGLCAADDEDEELAPALLSMRCFFNSWTCVAKSLACELNMLDGADGASMAGCSSSSSSALSMMEELMLRNAAALVCTILRAARNSRLSSRESVLSANFREMSRASLRRFLNVLLCVRNSLFSKRVVSSTGTIAWLSLAGALSVVVAAVSDAAGNSGSSGPAGGIEGC